MPAVLSRNVLRALLQMPKRMKYVSLLLAIRMCAGYLNFLLGPVFKLSPSAGKAYIMKHSERPKTVKLSLRDGLSKPEAGGYFCI